MTFLMVYFLALGVAVLISYSIGSTQGTIDAYLSSLVIALAVPVYFFNLILHALKTEMESASEEEIGLEAVVLTVLKLLHGRLMGYQARLVAELRLRSFAIVWLAVVCHFGLILHRIYVQNPSVAEAKFEGRSILTWMVVSLVNSLNGVLLELPGRLNDVFRWVETDNLIMNTVLWIQNAFTTLFIVVIVGLLWQRKRNRKHRERDQA